MPAPSMPQLSPPDPPRTRSLDRVQLVLLDDHPLFREGLRAVLDADGSFDVLGEASNAEEALALVEAKQPRVVVADVSLPGTSGIDFARALRRRSPDSVVLVLTMHASPELAAEAFDAGACGYALKAEAPRSIVDAIRTVARGERYLSPTIPRSALEGRTSSNDPLDGLSPREKEVFRLVVKGYSNDNIARELDISIKTVQTHRAKINHKLGVHSTGELVRFAALRGLVSE
jgi:DNA-binding NarL/FixJ family response regulator